MTDKQIIIDDLDTRCPYHCNEKIGQCNNSSQETPHTYCIDNKDCIYKLYARKEQECEELKETIQLQNKMQMEVCEEKNTELNQLKAENENLKKEVRILKSNRLNMFEHLDIVQENKKLKQTLAEIKEFCIDHTQLIHDAYPYLNIILDKINEAEE